MYFFHVWRIDWVAKKRWSETFNQNPASQLPKRNFYVKDMHEVSTLSWSSVYTRWDTRFSRIWSYDLPQLPFDAAITLIYYRWCFIVPIQFMGPLMYLPTLMLDFVMAKNVWTCPMDLLGLIKVIRCSRPSEVAVCFGKVGNFVGTRGHSGADGRVGTSVTLHGAFGCIYVYYIYIWLLYDS